MHAPIDASHGARAYSGRPHRRRVALSSGNGHRRLEARRADHRGAGELPRAGWRLEDHRHADGDIAHRIQHDRADPPQTPGMTRRAMAAAVIAIAAIALYAPT